RSRRCCARAYGTDAAAHWGTGRRAGGGTVSAIPECRGHATPEEAALVGWAPVSQASVIRTYAWSDDEAHVIVDTIPSHPMDVSCTRQADGLWYVEGDFGPVWDELKR